MKPRVLHVITVYNGRIFVPRAIESAMRIDQAAATIDVLVLDDASPEPGWSEELRKICENLGAHYYRSPRNLGIPRNVSLGLLTAIKKGYDYVTINNSDVIFPSNLINVMVEACQKERVGSVTAWSNNVSIYSIGNCDPDKYLSNQRTVDFISATLNAKNGAEVIDIPAGISFCIMMPVDVVKKVGMMDPIFGRGYCEETDWSLRSLAMGYRICLAPGVFVYHQGQGSNVAAGIISGAHTTVPENEAIIDLRHPFFRRQCQAFEDTGIMNRYINDAVDCILNQAARTFGYSIIPGWVSDAEEVGDELRAEVLTKDFSPVLRYAYAGFEQRWPFEAVSSIQNVVNRFGEEYLRHNAFISLNGQRSWAVYPQQTW